jgi:hypothetical protein
MGGSMFRLRALLIAAGLLSAYPPIRLPAQVGYDPGRSPFRDVRGGSAVRFLVGYLGGDRGTVPVGPSDGTTFGVRLEMSLGRVTTLTAGFAYGQTTRYIVDPNKDSVSRRSALMDNGIALVDLGIQLSLTGAKTFHGVMPYVGASLGLATGKSLPTDTSGYVFRTKLTVAPGAGLRWYPARRLSIQADLRAVFWKLSYPIAFKAPAPDGSRVLALTDPETDWTTHPWISLGVGWTF